MNESMIAYTKKEVLFSSLVESNANFKAFYDLPIVHNMSLDHAMLLFSTMSLKAFKAGDTVYEAGRATAGEMYLILDGKVNVCNESGHQYTSLRQGEVFGLFSFLDGSRSHSATITVERDIEVLTLERSCFDMIGIEDAKLGEQLMRFMFQLLSQKALEMEVEYAHMHKFAFGGKV